MEFEIGQIHWDASYQNLNVENVEKLELGLHTKTHVQCLQNLPACDWLCQSDRKRINRRMGM